MKPFLESLGKDQFTTGIGEILTKLREDTDPPAKIQQLVHDAIRGLAEYDQSQPVMRRITSTEEITINPNRNAYSDYQGTAFAGPDNMMMDIEKPIGIDGELGIQRIGIFSNHGETAPFVLWNWLQGFFKGHRRLSKLNMDGHGDEMRSQTSNPWDMKNAQGKTLFELAVEGGNKYGISSFHAGLVEAGVYDPEQWWLKTLIDRWDNNSFCYQERPRFIGLQDTMIQFDCEVEAGTASDEQVRQAVPDVADIDIDYLYYVEDPQEIAYAIKKGAALANRSPMVNVITSPGWLDQELSVAYAKLHIELLKPQPDELLIDKYLEEMHKRLEMLGRKNMECGQKHIRNDGILYGDFANMTDATRAENIAKMKKILLLDFDDPKLAFRAEAPDKNTTEASFYYSSLGTMSEREAKAKVISELEIEHKLVPALLSSQYREVQEVGEELRDGKLFTSPKDLQSRADELPDLPQDRMSEEWRILCPEDYNIAKIAHHMKENLSNGEKEFGKDLRLMLGILKSDKITRCPVALKLSILGFLSRLGLEMIDIRIPLFNYPCPPIHVNLSEMANWRGRITGINGAYVQNPMVMDHITGAFTPREISQTLEIDGGGKANLVATNGNFTEEVEFSFTACGQAAPELFARALAGGYFFMDGPPSKGGKVISAAGENKGERWDIKFVKDKKTYERELKLRGMTEKKYDFGMPAPSNGWATSAPIKIPQQGIHETLMGMTDSAFLMRIKRDFVQIPEDVIAENPSLYEAAGEWLKSVSDLYIAIEQWDTTAARKAIKDISLKEKEFNPAQFRGMQILHRSINRANLPTLLDWMDTQWQAKQAT